MIKGTLQTIAAMVRAEKLERTALILVGHTLAAKEFRDSALYSTDYDRRFRPSAREDRR